MPTFLISFQQHGSVYWKKGSLSKLQDVNSELTLYDQLKDAFSLPYSPIWMDSSTKEECRLFMLRYFPNIPNSVQTHELDFNSNPMQRQKSLITKQFISLPVFFYTEEVLS